MGSGGLLGRGGGSVAWPLGWSSHAGQQVQESVLEYGDAGSLLGGLAALCLWQRLQ